MWSMGKGMEETFGDEAVEEAVTEKRNMTKETFFFY